MQTENLFELTYILLEKRQVTAGQMAEHFGVSQRTIYRWVDALNLAGVPVYSTKGKGGGIHVSENMHWTNPFLQMPKKKKFFPA